MRKKVLVLLILVALLGSLLSCGPKTSDVAPLARYMPTETVVFLSVQVHPEGKPAENWRRIRNTFTDIPVVKEALDEFVAQAKEELPFDWGEDVDPWLGQTMAIGITDLDPLWEEIGRQAAYGGLDTVEPPTEVPFLLAVDVKDRDAFASFRAIVLTEAEAAGATVEESSFAGTTLYTVSTEEGTVTFGLAEADCVLLSTERSMIEEALEREEKDSLAQDDQFTNLIAQLPSEGLVLGYAAVGSLVEGVRDALIEQQGIPFPESWVSGVKAAGFALLADPEGLRIETVTALDWAAMAEAGLREFYEDTLRALPGRSLELIPKETAFAIAGQNLRGVWEMQMTQLEQTDPDSYDLVQGTLEDMTAQTGLDLEEDVLSWMTGEFALWLAPGETLGARTEVGIPSFRAGLLFEVDDRETAEQTMKLVEGLLAEEDLPFFTEEIEGVDARVIAMLEPMGYLPGYAFVDDFLLIAIDEPSFRGAIRASKDKGDRLAASPGFGTLSEKVAEDKTNLFFLDFRPLTKFIDSALEEPERSDFRKDVRPFLDRLGVMGMAGAAGKAGDDYTTSTFFLQIVP